MQAVQPLDGAHQHVSPPLSHGKQEVESDDGNVVHSGDDNDPDDDHDEPDAAPNGKRKRPISVSYVYFLSTFVTQITHVAYTPNSPNPLLFSLPCFAYFPFLFSLLPFLSTRLHLFFPSPGLLMFYAFKLPLWPARCCTWHHPLVNRGHVAGICPRKLTTPNVTIAKASE